MPCWGEAMIISLFVAKGICMMMGMKRTMNMIHWILRWKKGNLVNMIPLLLSCPREQQRINKPLKTIVVVKLLGRKIGFKALETCLKYIWITCGKIGSIQLNMKAFTFFVLHVVSLIIYGRVV